MVIRNLHCCTRHLLAVLLAFTLFHSPQQIHGQCTSKIAENPPEFEVASIRPSDKPGVIGIFTSKGGRVEVSHLTLSQLIQFAFGLQEYQIEGVPDWAHKQTYEITAIPPDSSPARQLSPKGFKTPLNAEQCAMLQQLVIQRFSLKFHRANKEGPVYWLTKGKKKLALMPPKNNTAVPYANVITYSDGVNNGEMEGINTSMSYFAAQLSSILGRLVIDKTDIAGSYDFHVDPPEAANADITYSTFEGVRKLGLQLQPAKGTIESFVIDSAAIPANE